MMKFKKFLAAAMTGAMMLGTVVTAAPTMSVYAAGTAATEITLTAGDQTVGQGQSIRISASTNETGDAAHPAITFSIPTIEGVSINEQSGILEVASTVPVDTKITVTASSASPTLTKTIDITVTKKQTAHYVIGGEEDGSGNVPYLSIEDCFGNYIYVAYYSDKEGKKLKSTYVYTSEELGEGGSLSLSGFNLKKGASFRVYDERTDIDDVHLVVVEGQSDAVKVKVKDFTKEALWEILEIKVGTTTISETNYAQYADKLFIDGIALEEQEPTEWVNTLKLAARATGMTFYVKYLANKNSTASETKFKISAAPKAPKIAIDYVNGAYTIAKNTCYTIANVDEDGIIQFPEVALEAADNKLVLSIEEVIAAAPKVYVKLANDATFDANATYYTKNDTYTAATGLDEATFNAKKKMYYILNGTTYESAIDKTFSSDTTYYTLTKTEYTKATVAADTFATQKASLYTEEIQTAAAIIAQSKAKGSKMESLMTVYKVESLPSLNLSSTSADGKTVTYSSGTGSEAVKVAELVFSDTGVTVTASKDIAYWDAAARTPKWVTLKATKSTREIALTGDATFKFKLLGVKNTQFGSAEVVTTNVYENTKPVEIIESVAGVTSENKETGATYYSDKDCTIVATPNETPTAYYLKATYTIVPATVETPVSGTKYYTTTNRETFTEVANLEAFVDGTVYYTRTVK